MKRIKFKGETAKRRTSSTKARALCSRLRGVAKAARDHATQAGENPKLAEHAGIIRTLGKRVIKDIIEIGRRLQEAKALVGHGGWEAWLEQEFDWSTVTAQNYMRVFELSEDFKSKNFLDLTIAPSALYLLARKSTPEPVRQAVIERAEAGEDVTVKTVKEAVATNGQSAPVATETEMTETEATIASPTHDWRGDVRRGFREALKVANDAVRIGEQVRSNGDISLELRQQMRETLEPLRGELPEIKKGAQGLLDYFDFIEDILADAEPLVLAEVAE